jgi:hypothetical protein
MVEAAATTPTQSSGVSRLKENGLRTGLLDIVELRMAKKPMMQSVLNVLLTAFVCGSTIVRLLTSLNHIRREDCLSFIS